ncbi:MAG: Phospholipase D1 [Piccolia ochrophora]|nr:MAG: Phospholipase D1 [Piccolia ochrophora]
MEEARDESVSPMTKSPRATSLHIDHDSPNDAARAPNQTEPSPLRRQLNNETLSDASQPANGDLKPSSGADHSGGDRATRDGSSQSLPTLRGGSSLQKQTSESQMNGVAGVQNALQSSDASPNPNHEARSAGQQDGAVDTPRPPKHARMAESSTPPGRRSVQFTRPGLTMDQPGHSHSRHGSGSWEVDEESPSKERKGFALLSKLKALAVPGALQGHSRSQSGYTIGGDSIDSGPPGPKSPGSERGDHHHGGMLDEDRIDEDADAEDSAVDEAGASSKGKRTKRYRKRLDGGSQTAPTTPKSPLDRSARNALNDSPNSSPSEGNRPRFLRRRATMTDIPEDRRVGVSEDEGRDRLGKESAWRRGSAWVQGGRGASYSASRGQPQGTPEGRRPSNFRRLTGLGGALEGGEASIAAQWRKGGERASSVSAHRWRALKAGLKLMGQKKKEESRIDNAKSAELLAELTAGTPAALMFASMFQRDERGNKRIPVLMEQLKISLTDSKRVDNKASGDRHQVFRIELEYGSGLTRMKWVIHRALRDFANLHLRYKLQASSEKYKHLYGREDASRQRLPRFPRTAFPYLRTARGFGSDDEEDVEAGEDEPAPSANDGGGSGTERHGKKRRKRPVNPMKRASSQALRSQSIDASSGLGVSPGHPGGVRRDPYPERQRKKLELYLQQMIRHLIFRPDSNRLCKFLELSALGVRLAAEGSYHGKEGYLMIQSSKGFDFRRAWNASLAAKRHAPKWFLVRHSYIVCVDSPEAMNIYDVILVDSDFHMQSNLKRLRDKTPKDIAMSAKESATHPKHHSLRIVNSERKLKLLAKNERQLGQFEDSIRFMSGDTIWGKRHRFDSFAPVRKNVFAQWLVDGRDYMWNVSRAISMARDVIYIHGWWLSPELYMRRPAAISQKWRLDRLLQRKANEGVKVFVIVYRNINSAIPIDSSYTKFSLLDLHPNVFVQRSPNQFRQNTFFWAHHEKICIVDHTVAFVGGIDLCFGRWDTPQHSVCDDKLTGFELSDAPKDADHCQLWPGKDYSNPRVQDFYALDKPYEEMYDRTKVPRMPWHDISMQIVGQPARDLTRHFVQRWNYVLRQRKPTRPTPFLLPPADFNPADLEALGLDGTCEVQILRSACWWSIGTPTRTEHSIMNAYVKMIEQSDYFVYMENQFFITSCEVEGTQIENLIGDALVERIIRAHKNGQDWRAVIVIPLMPGFQNTVDQQDGTSVRLIMQCQYRSICRGESSIFGRLRAHDIEPEDYIQFYGLRSWGKIGPGQMLVTEQLYIHAKCMIVDDRIAIIGSANINERSMLGLRDSECAAVVRDTDMLWSTMNGEPYLVGRFPHSLRMRLMREHMGLNVDEIMEEERRQEPAAQRSRGDFDDSDSDAKSERSESMSKDKETELKIIEAQHRTQDEVLAKSDKMYSFNHDIDWEQANNPNIITNRAYTEDRRVTHNEEHERDVKGEGADNMVEEERAGLSTGRDSFVTDEDQEVLASNVAPERLGKSSTPQGDSRNDSSSRSRSGQSDQQLGELMPPPVLDRTTSSQLGLPMPSQLPAVPPTDDTDIGGPSLFRASSTRSDKVNPIVGDMKRPIVEKDCFRDPLNDSFYLDIWHTVAENNAKLFRNVFRCMPDNEVQTWKEYKEYAAYAERFSQAQGGARSRARQEQDHQGRSGPPGQESAIEKLAMLGPIGETISNAHEAVEKVLDRSPSKRQKGIGGGNVEDWADDATHVQWENQQHEKSAMTDAEKQQQQQQRTQSPTSTTLLSVDEKSSAFPTLDTHQPTASPSNVDAEKSPPAPRHAQAQPPPPLPPTASNSQKRRRRGTTRGSRRDFRASDDMLHAREAEELMRMTQGHLVVWPYDWLVKEEQGGNWLHNIDVLAPLEI